MLATKAIAVGMIGVFLSTARAQVVVGGCDETSLDDAISLAQSLGSNVVFTSDCTTPITLSAPLDITTSTTIDAQGHTVTISGGGSTNGTGVTVFYIEPGVTNLTLIGLTITGGQNSNGGAIFVNPNSTVVLSNCTLTANTAIQGGGLYISANATVVMSNCTLTANSAVGTNGLAGVNGNNGGSTGGRGSDGTSGSSGLGGAIYNLGLVTLQQCLLSGNSALGGSGGPGGNGGNGNITGGNGGNGGSGANGLGGAICNLGTLWLKDSTFSANSAVGGAGGAGGTNGSGPFASATGDGGAGGSAYGAGVYSPGFSTVMNCTFSTNTTTGGSSAAAGTSASSGNGLNGKNGGTGLGGGICNLGTNIFVNCTLAGNTATGGNGGNGGPSNYAGPSGNGGNGGTGSGGGFYNGSMTHVTNCTFAFCGASGGGGGTNGGGIFNGSDGSSGPSNGGDLANGGGSFTLKNSIIATNISGGNGYGSITDAGHNLSSDTSISFTASSSTNNIEPKLGPLADNTGPTKTMALRPGSPAIDAAGTNYADFPATDQRGVSRRPPPGAGCDIGAYEVSPPVIQAINTQPPGQIIPTGGMGAQVVGQTNGGMITFAAQVVGELPLKFRWRFQGTNILGSASTNSTYTLSNVTISNAGPYTLFVTNAYGAVTSGVVNLGLAPFITTEPSDQTVSPSDIANFSVTATGSPNLAYQWYLANYNGTNPVAGATDTNLMIGAPQQTNSGGYFVIVTNAFGADTSAVANLTVSAPPYILLQPASLTVTQGSSVTFSVVALGATGYQWRTNLGANFVNVPNATGTNYFLPNVTTNQSGLRVEVVVTNGASSGVITSTIATLTVASAGTPPTITTQPTNQSVPVGASATFSVVAAGFPPLFYQWYFNSTNSISGATNSDLNFLSLQTNQAGNYNVVVTNLFGSIISSQATLVVLPPSSPLITSQPTNQVVLQGNSASFAVGVIGTGPLAYQWYFNFNGTNNPIPGATGATFVVTNAQSSNAGLYSVIITNLQGSTNSAQALLTVNVPAYVASQSSDLTVVAGTNVSMFVIGGGTLPIVYQWSKNGTPIGDATNSTYTINSAQTTDTGTYYASVQNAYGSMVSEDINLSVISLPTILMQPAGSNYAAIGGSATLGVVATGSNPLAYQWRFNGVNRSGATNTTLVLTNVQTNDFGIYTVVITNLFGSVTSTPATLTLGVAPSIITGPSSQTLGTNCTATFNVIVSGSPPLGYQWRLGGFNLTDNAQISGSLSNLLMIANVQTANAGSYTVVVTNAFGSTTSAPPAMLNVDTTGYTVSGRVLNGTNGVSGANVVAAGTNGPARSAVTDTNGNYTIIGVQPGTNSLTVSLAGYNFSGPVPLTVANCINAIDFFAQYTIGGRITDGVGSGLSGVTVTITGPQSGTFKPTTDSGGAYSYSGLPADTYTVTPSKSGVAFSPDSITVPMPPVETNVNFVGGPYFVSIVRLANGQVRLTLFGPVDGATHIQASTNLPASAWINLFTNKTSNQFLDTNAPNFRQRFYRAVR